MFPPVPEKLNLPAFDREILDFWKTNDVFQKSVARASAKGDFVFYDGPPGTNGLPHIGHMMQSALKDLWPRYKTMQGYRVVRKAGWDTHGLPIELTADKELGFTSKLDIAKYGEQEYVDYCRKTVFRFKAEWERAIRRVGRFVDLENDYATYQPYYIQSDWWTLKQAWDLELDGEARERAIRLGQSPRYLYKDYRVMAYSPRTGTTLSNFEVAQGYEEVTDLTLFVKFKHVGQANTYLTAWTTTPWTLLSNLAVAVGANIEYITVELLEDGSAGKRGDKLILAHARHQACEAMFGKHHIVGHHSGKDLEGWKYEPLFDWLSEVKAPNAFTVVCDDYVTTEDGTGLVHLANYGEDDFRILRKLEIPVVLTVDANGRVGDHAKPFNGREFREEGLDVDILKFLQAKGLLLGKEKYTHTYPFDYRTKTPLMYFPRPAWFIRATALKDMMIEANKLIGWKPDHIREGRFGKWLENVMDWNVTRERYWGSPLPVWQTADGTESICIESIAELERLAGENNTPLVEGFDPHKPQIDNIILRSKTGLEMRRENFVLDSWFNAGIMPWGQFGFPAEPGSSEQFLAQYPADFICEGQDQTRGWFYTLLACSCLVAKSMQQKAKTAEQKKFWSNPHNWSSYKNVICTELVLDSKGLKMSKSLGNVVDPMALFEKFGADPVRWMFYRSNPWTAIRFGEAEISDVMRAVILPYWNSYSFFMTYAHIDGWTPQESNVVRERSLIDRWIISEYHRTIEQMALSLDNYDVMPAAAAVEKFLDNLTNWYIRRSRRRFWKSESDSDKATAYATLYEILVGLTKSLAPFIPFISEHIYRNLVSSINPKAAESVHLADYPVADSSQRDRDLERHMAQVTSAVTLARALRQERNLKVRQPLQELVWVVPDESKSADLAPFLQIIADELNVKTVEFRHDDSEFVHRSAAANFRTLGKKVGTRMKEVADFIATLTDTDIRNIEAGSTVKFAEWEFTAEDIQIRRTEKTGFALKSDGYMTVALEIDLTPELVAEGHAREVVHHIQNLRKESGFAITDRIGIVAATNSAELLSALKLYEDYIRRETLAVKFEFNSVMDGQEHDSNGHPVMLTVRKAITA